MEYVSLQNFVTNRGIRPDDASTKLGELETNLSKRCHGLMRAISEA
jgi:hypothetical protein